MPKHKKLTKSKAKEILRHGEVRGHKLTKAQKGLFGLIAGGGKPTRLRGGRRGDGKLGYSKLKGF